MIHITKQLDGERLREWLYEGFVDEAVLVVPVGDQLVECGFRVMDTPSHTGPTEAARAATLDEIAEVVHGMGQVVSVQSSVFRGNIELGDLDDEHPLWCVNEQIKDLLTGNGATEDHEMVLQFLRDTGLPEGTVRRIHEAIVCAEVEGGAE